MSGSRKSHRRVVLMSVAAVMVMTGFSFAAVPLYRLFCQATGLDGTTQRAAEAPATISDRMVTVTFNADVATDMPWKFYPLQKSVRVKVGEKALIYYRAENPTTETIAGQASFNVTPEKTGRYFSKIQCFCFDKQILKPGQAEDMAVTFFVDPALLDDRYMDDVTDITLSYTFFRLPPEAAGIDTGEADDHVHAAADHTSDAGKTALIP